MTQEQKDLLLKDLCARMPYGVILNCCKTVNETLTLIDYKGLVNNDYDIDKVKPYLFPMSSMTEKQKEEFNTQSLKLQLQVIDEEIMYEKATEFEVDFYNKHHLDWRGLIPLGLAIDATNLNIY